MSKDFSDILKSSGLKNTHTREAILNVFSNDCKPINAEYIFKKLGFKSGLKYRSSKINLVTIYRALASFEEAGIVRRVDIHKDSAYYELSEHHHHHIVCTKCGMVESFENCYVADITKEILRKSAKFKNVSQHSFEFFGICKSCSK